MWSNESKSYQEQALNLTANYDLIIATLFIPCFSALSEDWDDYIMGSNELMAAGI